MLIQHPAKSWLGCHSNSFIEIQDIAQVKDSWKSFKKVIDNPKYTNAILKPVNNYVLNLYPKPDLIHFTENKVVLRQRTHAEIWIYDYKTHLYALDRPHQRQFYPSKLEDFSHTDLFFKEQFRFYIPWVIDDECMIQYKNVESEETPFFIFEKNIQYNKIDRSMNRIETDFIPFYIYKNGKYKIDDDYGIIRIGTPTYDIIIENNNSIVGKIKEFYGAS